MAGYYKLLQEYSDTVEFTPHLGCTIWSAEGDVFGAHSRDMLLRGSYFAFSANGKFKFKRFSPYVRFDSDYFGNSAPGLKKVGYIKTP